MTEMLEKEVHALRDELRSKGYVYEREAADNDAGSIERWLSKKEEVSIEAVGRRGVQRVYEVTRGTP